jgi:hypothetical protein
MAVPGAWAALRVGSPDGPVAVEPSASAVSIELVETSRRRAILGRLPEGKTARVEAGSR